MNNSGFKKIIFIVLLFVASIAGAYRIQAVQSNKQTSAVVPKPNTYSKDWQKVEAFEKKGLYKSALEVVDAIYKKAKAENNAAQLAKSILYRMKFSKEIEENASEKSITYLNEELKGANYPLKPLLHSILGQVYWNYYQAHRWQYNKRTPTSISNDDPTTWDMKTIFSKAHQQYQLSLQNPEKLKQTAIDMYDVVLIEQKDTRKFRPTLYDFLAYRAIDFYRNEEVDIIKPAYKFELKEDLYFQPYEAFSKQVFTTKDSLSSSFYALKLIQDLIKFHIPDVSSGKAEVLINIDLDRLKFVKEKSTLEIKDSLYLSALQKLEKQFASDPASAEINYEIAKVFVDKGDLYKPLESEAHKWKKKQAIELCDEVIKKYPQSNGAKNCAALKEDIKTHGLDLVMDNIISPDKPALGLLTYKNVKKVYFRIIQPGKPDKKDGEQSLYGEELINYYLKSPSLKDWTLDLPDDEDYQSHATEIKIPELNVGEYVILMSSGKDFLTKNNGVAHTSLTVSGISYVMHQLNDGSYDCLVQHRETGAPLKDVNVQLIYEKYDYKTRKREVNAVDKYVTDVNGYFNIPPTNQYRQGKMEFSYAKPTSSKNSSDFLVINNAIYQYEKGALENKKTGNTFFFLDRGIYRPGQTVYFKGIMVNKEGENHEIITKAKTNVNLIDANGQTVSKLELISNDYGTFTGSFVIPAGILTGSLQIGNESGAINFSVEEYKRPKFEVSFLPVKGSYRLNDQVQITGSTKTFSGAFLSGATVKYRVVRNSIFRPYYYYAKSFMPNTPSLEIANGVLTTSDTGSFVISFNAIADANTSKKNVSSFSFTVYADVTDINGETHSSQEQLIISYVALNLNVDVPEAVDKLTKDMEFPVHITNMSGEAVPTSCKVEIYKLKQPLKIYRDRKWKQPDQHVISKEEFEKDFPTDQYTNEKDKSTWARQEKVLDQSLESFRQSVKTINLKSWASGDYVLEAHCKDKNGEDVMVLKYFTVYSIADKQLAVNEVNWFVENMKKVVEPGDKAKFIIGSKETDVHVLYEIERVGTVLKKELIVLNNEQKVIELPIEEKHRGGITLRYVFIKNNRVYTSSTRLEVPFTNKELDIQFETFRDKLLPGQQEEWKLKIKGKKGDKALAEMVATLYDASLDQFSVNAWDFDIYRIYSSQFEWDTQGAFALTNSNLVENEWNKSLPVNFRTYDQLSFGYEGSGTGDGGGRNLRNVLAGMKNKMSPVTMSRENAGDSYSVEEVVAKGTNHAAIEVKPQQKNLSTVATRKNFSETAFFYPQLETDKDGNVIIKFTIHETTTRWKMMGLAHTKDLKIGSVSKELVTQKELMVTPNAPRFFREDDKLELTAKITNLTQADMQGEAQLFLYDALTMKDISDSLLSSNPAQKTFMLSKQQNTMVGWSLNIPKNIGAITYKVVAKAGNFTDGEEMTVPVLSNRMLVTESLPLYVNGNQTKNFRFEKLASQNNGSSTLSNHKLTVEFTSNPAWYAVQALPYLMEYPYDCSEQIFSRLYANSLATHIASSSPKIKAVFDAWKNTPADKASLLSNLEKNQELKSLLLEETPWVMEAKDESERKKRLGLLFDLNKMSNEQAIAIQQLKKRQAEDGSWPWFDGMFADRYITQYIVTGLGHLQQLQVKEIKENTDVARMLENAIQYLDNRIREDYEDAKRFKLKTEVNQVGDLQIQYLYMRSYFKDIAVADANKTAFNYYLNQAQKYWLPSGRYLQGMLALALNRYDKKETALAIMKSLKETSIHSEEMGMYWKENYENYYWHQAPIESQALMIEAFDEVLNDVQSVDALKIWLLRSKQTQNWKTTKATAEAIYALLLKGTDWLSTENSVALKIGSTIISADQQKDETTKVEAGTGYFKTSWVNTQIQPSMADVTITKKDAGVSWGAMYWQYFEQLDKITPHKTPLLLKKNLFIQKTTDAGFVLEQITNDSKLKVGDKVIVRIELKVDRMMEYVRMKDMRASGFEPINVMSSYKYQDGLGYYESTRDAATNFFFSDLPKGSYVFEYPLVITHEGDFSNGMTSIQCMYAPEFSSHSEGVRVKVD